MAERETETLPSVWSRPGSRMPCQQIFCCGCCERMEYESVFVGVDGYAPLRTGSESGSQNHPGLRLPKTAHADILKAIQSKDPKDCYVFKKARNCMNYEIYQPTWPKRTNTSPHLKRMRGIQLTSRKQTKKTWHRIKEIEVNGTPITELEIILKSFNQHFAIVGPKLAAQILSSTGPHLYYITPLLGDYRCRSKSFRNFKGFSIIFPKISDTFQLFAKIGIFLIPLSITFNFRVRNVQVSFF